MQAYSNIAGTREHDIFERTQISLTSLTTLNTNYQTKRGTSEGSETSEQENSKRQIQVYCVF